MCHKYINANLALCSATTRQIFPLQMYEEIEFFMSVCSGGKCTEVIFEMLGNLNVSKFLLKRHNWLTLQTAKFMSHHFTKFPRLFFHIFLQQINI